MKDLIEVARGVGVMIQYPHNGPDAMPFVCMGKDELAAFAEAIRAEERAAIAASAQDAARYRWLRDRSAWTLISANGITRLAARLPVMMEPQADDDMDAAIDAAMKEPKP